MQNTKVDFKAISKEVIQLLVNLTRGVIGYNIGSVLLRELDIKDITNGKEIVYKFSQSLEDTLGKGGAHATLKQVGRELAETLMSESPNSEWDKLFKTALNDFGYAQIIEKNTDSAYICNCVFYDILQVNNLEPTEHPVCWTGWGFIEGFMKVMEGVQRIKWVERDILNNRCKFDFIWNNEDLNFK